MKTQNHSLVWLETDVTKPRDSYESYLIRIWVVSKDQKLHKLAEGVSKGRPNFNRVLEVLIYSGHLPQALQQRDEDGDYLMSNPAYAKRHGWNFQRVQ